MADMSSLDELLSSSIKSAAEPAASAGVADAIRSRVAAGDAGTSVAGSTAPGWGGGASGALTIVAPIALIVVAGVVGGGLGASGVFGAPAGPLDGNVPAYVTTDQTATAYVCPGGPQLGDLRAGTRVLAVARDADLAFLGVRNLDDFSTTIWFSTDDLVLDEAAVDPSTLPVESCPDVTVTVVTPTPTPTPEPEDTTPPVLDKMSANPPLVYNDGPSQISLSARDDVGVAGVALSWSGPNGLSGSAPMTLDGSTWRYTWSYGGGTVGDGVWTFTAVASDAAGNQSAPAQVVVERQYFG